MTDTTLIKDLTVAEFKDLMQSIVETPAKEEALSLQETAALLGVTKKTVMKYVKDPNTQLEAVYFGTQRPRFSKKTVETFISSGHKPRQRH